ncbi:glycerate kinase [Cohnella boryungensis]|uniref:Glycerate kinase n=1 Tax=Cohnella boryungensis TaxID=768479 RepID=A0ABV8SFW6_9BACL
MKIVVAPDSFKESLTSLQAATAIAQGIRESIPSAQVEIAPMADGGEGTVEALTAAAKGTLHHAIVCGPLGLPIETTYGLIARRSDVGDSETATRTAVIEAASLFGLQQTPASRRDPYVTTTRGMGELLLQLLDEGIRSFVIGLGGSATNDGGMGLLAALGARFYDADERLLPGFGRDLPEVRRIDGSGLDSRLADCDILVASDVRNQLCGEQGASAVYGPQKGATPEQIAALDEALRRYASLWAEEAGRAAMEIPGAGAAGGAGYALLLLGARMAPGAEVVASEARLREKLADADWVVTGEGKSDAQTLFGKLPVYVARLAKSAGVRTILLSGSLGDNARELESEFAACFPCVPRPMALAECLEQAEDHLRSCARNVARLLSAQAR